MYNTITFENKKIFIISDNNNRIWFNAKQICLSLEYKEPNKAITKNVDKDDQIQLKISRIFNILLMNVKQENVMYVIHSNKKGNTDRYNIGMKIRKILSLNKINNILYLKYTKVP